MQQRKQMVQPTQVEVTVTQRVERGTGVRVQTEITTETHERLQLELMRRRRRGAPGTVMDLLAEIIDREAQHWPEPLDTDNLAQ